jgi:NAD(P)-dependent dehydrogenase (short-subunit alcohol dehydrogenase family)
MDSLAGKLILVTGAARRIGRALALACASAGADVIVHYRRSSDEAERTRADVEGLGRRAWAVQADLENPREAAALITRAARSGALFGLVNNAAVFGPGDTWRSTDEDWTRTLAINLTAPFVLCREFIQAVPAGQDARIVNILDWRSLRPDPGHLAYSVSKAGLAALTKALAADAAPSISVNGLALGAILPPSTGKAPARLLESIPLGRWGDLQEVQSALLFLLTGPKYITGELLHVDGGRHLV